MEVEVTYEHEVHRACRDHHHELQRLMSSKGEGFGLDGGILVQKPNPQAKWTLAEGSPSPQRGEDPASVWAALLAAGMASTRWTCYCAFVI